VSGENGDGDGAAAVAVARDAYASSFQREDVDAAVRSEEREYVSPVDPRGVAAATEVAGQLVEHLGARVDAWSVYCDEVTLDVPVDALVEASTWLRDKAGFALLSDLSPCDRWSSERVHPKRFSVAYLFTKLAPGAPRLRLRVWVDEGEPVPSLVDVYPTADWHEREAYDFFGIEFSGRAGLRRLIMADDWVGHPLRKDYPIGGEPVKFTNSLREI
jgi:NADH-quinone oxidoreductase subunit C